MEDLDLNSIFYSFLEKEHVEMDGINRRTRKWPENT
jgi:hypothetical protein